MSNAQSFRSSTSVLVRGVSEDGPAAKAGLKENDIILQTSASGGPNVSGKSYDKLELERKSPADLRDYERMNLDTTPASDHSDERSLSARQRRTRPQK